MKAKYKIGTLVSVENLDGSVRLGEIEAIITARDGYAYVLESDPLTGAFAEEKIRSAYKPLGVRKSKPRKSKPKLEESAA